MLACASLSFSPCPPTRKAGQSQKPAWRWQFRLRWENPKKIERWPALLHVTILECWRFIFFLWRTVPSQWALQASLNPVSVSTTVSRFPMGVFLRVIGRGLPGSLFIIWPESLKGNPFSMWVMELCDEPFIIVLRGETEDGQVHYLKDVLLSLRSNFPHLSWNTIMLYCDEVFQLKICILLISIICTRVSLFVGMCMWVCL